MHRATREAASRRAAPFRRTSGLLPSCFRTVQPGRHRTATASDSSLQSRVRPCLMVVPSTMSGKSSGGELSCLASMPPRVFFRPRACRVAGRRQGADDAKSSDARLPMPGLPCGAMPGPDCARNLFSSRQFPCATSVTDTLRTATHSSERSVPARESRTRWRRPSHASRWIALAKPRDEPSRDGDGAGRRSVRCPAHRERRGARCGVTYSAPRRSRKYAPPGSSADSDNARLRAPASPSRESSAGIRRHQSDEGRCECLDQAALPEVRAPFRQGGALSKPRGNLLHSPGEAARR